jgi:hypothetical protein
MNAEPSSQSNGHVGELLHRITDDVKTIARDEIDLAKSEIARHAKLAAAEAALVVLGGIVALIGFAMLCTAVVVALAPWIPSLAVRLIIMAAVYIVVGGVVAGGFAKRLTSDIKPDLSVAAYEAKHTVSSVKESLSHS